MIPRRVTDKWIDDSKYSAKHNKQPWAILETSYLSDGLYHGYNCFVPVVRQRNIIEQNERCTNASCSHPANRSAHNQLVHILCNRTDQRARLENGNVPYEDPLGGENA